jgi:hypothetical protein
VRLRVPRNRGPNTTLLAAMTLDGMGETMAVEGSTNQEVFEAYMEYALAPTLQAGEVVILEQPLRAQTGQGEGTGRRARLPADLPAGLLAGFQSDRGSVCQDQGHSAPSRSPYQGCFGRRAGRSAFGDQRPRRQGLLRACWLCSTSPTTVKRAVRSGSSVAAINMVKAVLGDKYFVLRSPVFRLVTGFAMPSGNRW